MRKAYYNVEFDTTQKHAIKELILHVFGSFENYDIYKDSGKPFPDDYKWTKRIIERKVYASEYFNTIIACCHKAVIPEKSYEKEIFEEHGSNGGGIYVEGKSVIVDKTNHEPGNKRPHNPWDDVQLKTYQTRITSLQSIRRRANWTDSEILEFSIKYTEEYNREFGTNFKVYISKKRVKKI